MAFKAILDEVDQLQNVSTRLEGLADQHPPVTEALITIAGNVRSVATLLAVLVATKLHGADEHARRDGQEHGQEAPQDEHRPPCEREPRRRSPERREEPELLPSQEPCQHGSAGRPVE